MATKAHERDKLERLCRYIARPAVSTQRLSLTRNGQIRYQLKTPYTDGTTQVIFEPLDLMYRMYGMPRAQEAQERPIARLVALDCRDAGGRATQEQLPRCPGPGSISPVITVYSPKAPTFGAPHS